MLTPVPWTAVLVYVGEDPWSEQPNQDDPTDSLLGLRGEFADQTRTHLGALRTMHVHCQLYDRIVLLVDAIILRKNNVHIGVDMCIRVEPYEGRGITQCFTCNNFNHTSENCYITPRCLKCGEEHITRDCPIKPKLEQLYCINCQIYGHMANWQGCPCYPKPPTTHKNKHTFTNIFNSIVLPNTTNAQVTSTKQNTNNYKNQRQMAPHYNQHAGNSRQTGAINLPPITPVSIQNYPLDQNNASIQQTLQLILTHYNSTNIALTQVSQAFNGATGIGQNLNQISAAKGNPNQMYGLIEAACNTNYV
ncbi:uncharacterized protein TNCV_1783801 [Trichonephila clavipes]|nr:uncharacterized protein TNCV_1783801 [Trichonephila clavipes]